MSILDTLVTDRTQEDVDYARGLCLKGKDMTADELTDFLSSLKGMYNYTDLNRVETAVDYVATELVQADTDIRQYATDMGVAWDSAFEVPYDPSDYSLTVKTDWDEEDIPSATQMARYIGNLILIRDAIQDASNAWIPDSMNMIDYQIANDIEKLLIDVDVAVALLVATKEGLIRSALAVNYSGEIYSGEGEA